MKREWQPGDVAMYEYLGSGPLVALRVRGGNSRSGSDCPVDKHGGADHWHLSDGGWTRGTSGGIRRPLAVIDPEDREQVERLAAAYRAALTAELKLTDEPWSLPALRLQAALRQYADPKPPKPEEPTGLGAVVEDAEGRKWLRRITSRGRSPWGHYDETERTIRARDWSEIDVVRVLSEGVTE